LNELHADRVLGHCDPCCGMHLTTSFVRGAQKPRAVWWDCEGWSRCAAYLLRARPDLQRTRARDPGGRPPWHRTMP
jgi:hypothetical protein